MDFTRIRAELDAEFTIQNLQNGVTDQLVKHYILGLSEYIGSLLALGATRQFIESITEESITGAEKVKAALG